MLRCVTLLAFALIPMSFAAQGAAQGGADHPRSTMTGVYSAAQAARGEETYMNVCVACHPKGTYAAPNFRTTWNGRLISDLFDVVKEKMPKNDPGTLTPAEAAQVLAYLLKINDVPAGETELPDDVEALKKIRFEAPAAREGKAER
jgi:mono/diheme cytochrome c family protein